MDALKQVFIHYENIMDKEIVGVQLGCYSIALIGLSAAIQKVRPFSRFKKPGDIPNKFIHEKRELTGIVKRVDPNGALLLVQHEPLISLPIIPKGELPVKILGVDVNGLGVSWLQTVVVNSKVTFIPVKKELDFVQCEVLLPNINSIVGKVDKSKKESKILKILATRKENAILNVGEKLLRIGFAKFTPLDQPITNDRKAYCDALQSAQIYALKKELKIRYYWIPVKKLLNALVLKIANNVMDVVSKVVINVRNIPPKLKPA